MESGLHDLFVVAPGIGLRPRLDAGDVGILFA
jgi:hypothetical protein